VPRGTSTYTLTGISDGVHIVRVRAIDAAGNAAAVTVSVAVDTTPPSVSITGPAGGAVFTSPSAIVSWTATDATSGIDHVTVSLDGGAEATLSAATTSHLFTDLANGAHSVTVTVVDRAGHSSTSTVTFRVSGTGVGPASLLNMPLVMALVVALASGGVAAMILIRRRRNAD